MFTGIIKKTAKVQHAEHTLDGIVVRFELPKLWKVTLGESISVQGVCSTVARKGANWFEVDYMRETLKKTTVANFEKGNRVNLERSLRLADLVHGHLVSGHVDARGKISKVVHQGNSTELWVSAPKSVMKFIAPKGSVVLDGVALTVVEATRTSFSVALIPFTKRETTLGTLAKGSEVNIETDMLAKYVYRLLTHR